MTATTTADKPKKPILVWILGIGLVILGLVSALGALFISPTMPLPPEMPAAQVNYIRGLETSDIVMTWIVLALYVVAGAILFDMRRLALPLLGLLFVVTAGYYGFEIATAGYAEVFGWGAVALGVAPPLVALLYAFAIRHRLS